jgi:hypothetical protein
MKSLFAFNQSPELQPRNVPIKAEGVAYLSPQRAENAGTMVPEGGIMTINTGFMAIIQKPTIIRVYFA